MVRTPGLLYLICGVFVAGIRAISLNVTPSTIPIGNVYVVQWSRDAGDPTQFPLRLVNASGGLGTPLSLVLSSNGSGFSLSGKQTHTALDPGPFHIVAYNDDNATYQFASSNQATIVDPNAPTTPSTANQSSTSNSQSSTTSGTNSANPNSSSSAQTNASSASSPSGSSNTPLIAGIAVVGAIAAVALIALLFMCFRNHRKQLPNDSPPYPSQPFIQGLTSTSNHSIIQGYSTSPPVTSVPLSTTAEMGSPNLVPVRSAAFALANGNEGQDHNRLHSIDNETPSIRTYFSRSAASTEASPPTSQRSHQPLRDVKSPVRSSEQPPPEYPQSPA